MKKAISVLLCCSVLASAFSQKNLELVSHLDYVSLANDVWGYTAPDGTEYALAGLRSGVSIVSLADPANPVEIQFIPGEQSVWRDIKIWGSYAYVTADQPGTREGLLVIDLSQVPVKVTWSNWRPVLPNQSDTLFNCHNLWIDEFGYAYLSGCNVNNGGVIFVDVHSQPGTPEFAGYNAPVYAHDCFTSDNLLYTAEIYEGGFSVFDVSNKTSPQLLGNQETPYRFCHNVWLSPDGKVLFTTDERANAPTGAFDISDPGNIRQLDEFRPPATLNTGVIPHNVHVLGNYLVISHYTDGCVVVDATRPDNLVEAGFYDTSTGFLNGFHGCWGAFPYFPSGLIAATDIENGLFILKPTFKNACYLEGSVQDAQSGAPVAAARVEIQSPDANDASTGITGQFKTGQITSGTFDVKFRAQGYFDATAQATLSSGETTLLDISMTPLPPHTIAGQVLEKTTKAAIEGAIVLFENQDFSYTTETDDKGRFSLPAVLQGEYSIYVGHWGYENLAETKPFSGNTSLTFELAPAYEDNFNTDLGWTVSSTATKGFWERGFPRGTSGGGRLFAPGNDSPGDPGNQAYVTGNQGIAVHDDEVNDGATILISPPMQLRSRYNRPLVAFDYWFVDAISNFHALDSLTVLVSNGKMQTVLWFITTDTSNVQEWKPSPVLDLVDFIDITDDMRILFRAADDLAKPNVLEAGIDHFRVMEGLPNEYFLLKDDLVKMQVYPNPSGGDLRIDYKVEKNYNELYLLIYNTLGQVVWKQPLSEPLGSVQLDPGLIPGVYYVAFRLDDRVSKTTKWVRGF
jgi:choice-of-anchor B domain-containing protein